MNLAVSCKYRASQTALLVADRWNNIPGQEWIFAVPIEYQTSLTRRAVLSEDKPTEERERIEKRFRSLMREELELGSFVSYVGNKKVPLLRLYRYKEAFAFSFVQEFLRRFKISPSDYVLDPFAGMGTTLFTSMVRRIPSIGIDKLPIAVFAARTLPLFFTLRQGQLRTTFEKLKPLAQRIEPAHAAMDVPIISLAFDEKQLLALRRWKAAIETLKHPLQDIFLLLFFSILEATSYTSKDGQFLRLKRDKGVVDPDEALYQKILEAEHDLKTIGELFPATSPKNFPRVYLGDTRDLSHIPFDRSPTAIITSPPYVNRYDYTRSYCLELCFHFVGNFEELKSIRFGVLRSHIESKVGEDEQPPHPVIAEVVNALKEKKLNNPRIPFMLTGYFIDMKKAIREWGRILAPGAQVAVVVDNVRFEGELIPVDLVLSEMAEEAGFQVQHIIVSRYKGNSSQQMKKYGRVPVRESIVVWRKE